jgi:ATP-dependent helicase/nuclease subunit A
LGFTFLDQSSKKVEPLNYFRLKNISRLKTEAEEKRIFYVACTRAKEFLVISGIPNNSGNSYLNWLLDSLDINPDDMKPGEIVIPDQNVKTLELVGGKYQNKTLKHDLKIHVFTSPDGITTSSKQLPATPDATPIKNILIDPLEAQIRNDFFSATQIQTYLNCPTKYFLKYKIGLPENLVKQTYFHEEEDANDVIRGETLGMIIHSVLEKFQNYSEAEIRIHVNNIIESEHLDDHDKTHKYTDDILSKLKTIYSSSTVKEIFSHAEYKTEYTINSAFGEDFLTGTIDRLYKHSDGSWCIVDYKSDNVKASELKSRAENYKGQISFYTLLVSRLFGQNEVRACVLFTAHPDSTQWFHFKDKDIKEFEEKLYDIIQKIKTGKLEKNEAMCSNCTYAVDGKCIL